MTKPLEGKVALVAGGTRAAGRGIAVELGAAGATVYVTGRTTRTQPSEMKRPETIEETAELVTKAGGVGIAVQVDHLVPDQVRALVQRIEREQGRLHVLVNDIWGRRASSGTRRCGNRISSTAPHAAARRGDARHHQPLRAPAADQAPQRPRDRSDRRHRRVQREELPRVVLLRPREGRGEPHGLRALARAEEVPKGTALTLTPGWLRSEFMLDEFKVTEANWREATKFQPHFVISDCWRYMVEVMDPGKPADATGYR